MGGALKTVTKISIFVFIFVFLGFWLIYRDFLFSGVVAVIITSVFYFVRGSRVSGREHIGGVLKFLKDRKPDKKIERHTTHMLYIYALFLLLNLIFYKVFFLPDQIIFFGLVGAMVVGRGKKFIKDWAPLLILIFAYDAMRGFADNLNMLTNFTGLVKLEVGIFGFIPTVWLQNNFYHPGSLMWYDFLAFFLYLPHFLAPLFFAYILWIEKQEDLFKKFSATIVVVSYLSLMTFLAYPAAPPWMASAFGTIPKVHKIFMDVVTIWHSWWLASAYKFINVNDVAAFPSLHAAYPWLVYVFAVRRYGKKGHLMILFPLSVFLSLVYMGEHYVVDIIGGVIYAMVAYFFVEFVYRHQ